MSSHRDSRRPSDRERARYGRDERERSPARHDRSSREPRSEQGAHGGRSENPQERYGDRHGTQSSRLPIRVPVPTTGRELVIQGLPVSGTAGTDILLNVNFFEIQSLPIQKTYAYDMRLRVPESSQRRGSDKVTSMQQARALMHGAVKSFWGDDFVFDGVSTAWSPRELVRVGETVSTTIELEGHSPEHPNKIEIHIRNNGLLDIKSLVEYVQSGNVELNYMGNPTIEPLIRWLNFVYQKDPATHFTSQPQSNAFFKRSPSTSLQLQSTHDLLKTIRELFQTVQIHFKQLNLIMNISTAVFYISNQNLISLIYEFIKIFSRENIKR